MSMSDKRKRVRTDSGGPASISFGATGSNASGKHNQHRTRDNEFWFEDGNVIVVAGNVEFRVFKGILADHSPVMRDMFSLPQPRSESSQVSVVLPCPVVDVTDAPEDIRHILRLCIPKSESMLSPFSRNKFSYDMVSAVIRLGHKYQMSQLVDHAIAFLKGHFSDKFAVWANHKSCGFPDFEPVHSIGVVNLARLTGETSLLPTALLACCALGKEIAQGFRRDNGTREYLSSGDVGRCFSAHGRLVGEYIRIALTVFNPVISDGCTRQRRCRTKFQAFVNGFKAGADKVEAPYVFVKSLHRSLRFVYPDFNLCESCEEMVEKRAIDEQLALWKQLPEIMDITVHGWGEAM
ncbi:hypothetical protein C8Q78DRAFT_978509 [Trametes maxima]|nr:hypothetical protein C8Q78DRAFT_978509 [Trametes maxima]